MDKKVFFIYPICNRDDIGIFFNEETQKYITYTGEGEIPEKTIRNIGLIFTPIILGAHYSFNIFGWICLIQIFLDWLLCFFCFCIYVRHILYQ